jgi:hypothetical protein
MVSILLTEWKRIDIFAEPHATPVSHPSCPEHIALIKRLKVRETFHFLLRFFSSLIDSHASDVISSVCFFIIRKCSSIKQLYLLHWFSNIF